MSELNVDNLRNAIDLYKRKQYEDALPIFYQFAREGYVVAGFYIGMCTMHGWGCPEEVDRGADLIMKVAQEGYPPAQRVVGSLLERGIKELGVEANMDLAKQWYKAAADQGDNEAKKRLKELSSK